MNQTQTKTLTSLFINLYTLSLILIPIHSYIDIPLTISRPLQKTGQISLNFQLQISGYKQNISLSLNNKNHDYITSLQNMKIIYKQKKLKKSKDQLKQKNHNNLFGLLEVTSLQGYSLEGWKRYFMEAFLYIQSRYYHDIVINLDDLQKENYKKEELTHGIMTLGPNLKQNKLYQEIKKNTDFVNFDIVSIYCGVGERNNRLQLGGYQQEYAKGDYKTGALLYEVPLKISGQYWWLPVQKIFFTRSKSRKTDEFLVNPSLSLFKLSLQSEYIVFPESMRTTIQGYVQSQNNECKLTNEYLQCKNMSTIDLSLSQFAFQLSPNYFINISLYDLRREYIPETKTVSFYIKTSEDVNQIQIGSVILKQYYISIDMNQNTILYSKINRFGNSFSSIYVIRFILYFMIFTICTAICVGIWANFGDPTRKNKLQYGRNGIQLITYQRPGGILTTNTQLDD